MISNKILVEFQKPDGTWVNASEYRLDRDPVKLKRGRAPREKTTSPAEAEFTLKNPGGVFSLRNPLSPLYGQLKRNTPVRISLGQGAYGMVTSGVDQSAGRASTPDSAAVSITGDQDIRLDLELLTGAQSGVTSSWTVGNHDLASKFNDDNAARSWTLINIGGKLRYTWFALGTTASARFAESVALGGTAAGRRALRITHDVDNGAAGTTVTFYTAPTLAGPWTQLGTPVVSAGTTAVFDGTAPLRVGGPPVNTVYTYAEPPSATYYGFEIRSGIGGTVRASCDFTALPLDPSGISSSAFTDAQGNSWSFNGGVTAARIWWGNLFVRFFGETASLPPRWNPRHTDKSVHITANGVLRRYQQGKSPASTALRDFVLKDQQALLSYFPLDGGEGTQYSRNIANTGKYQYNFYNEPLPDKPIFKYGVDMGAAWIGSGMELERTNTTGWMRGDTVSWDSNVAFDFVWQSSSLGELSISLRDYNAALWTLTLNDISDSGLGQVSYTDPSSGPIGFATFAVPEINDTALHIGRLQITNNGANTDYAVYVDGTLRKSGTQPSVNTYGSAYFTIQYAHANTGQVAVNLAHLVTWANVSAAAIPSAASVADAALGYTGEAAGRRIERVCDDVGIPISFVGDPDDTTLMGVQFSESRIAQIRDAESTDFGILYEPRTSNGLAYRTRESMYNLTPAVVLNYAAKVVTPPFEPIDDDEATKNDVTATRRDGGSYRITKTTGPLAATDPPIGIGQYDDEVTVNVETDAQLPAVAAWQLNWGTLNAARYESVVVNMGALKQMVGQVAADALIAQIVAADVGDRLQVQNVDAADIPDDIDLQLLGYTETITNKTWEWAANCGPYDLFKVAKFGTDRYDADGSILTAAVTSSATSFQVTQAGTSIWTRTAFPFDVNIGGERMTVTNCTSATSPQTFTVTRGVNGIAKAHTAGEAVRLWDTPRFAL